MKTVYQDMLDVKQGVLFHQVNCQGIMGGGIAASLARKFPSLEDAYRAYIAKIVKTASEDREFIRSYLTEDGDILCKDDLANDVLLGRVFLYAVPQPHRSYPNDLYIANIFGQGYISTRCRMTNYDAVDRAFESLKNSPTIQNKSLYFPFKMGCGLGGGNWKIYSAIIESHFPDAIICQYNA